MLPAEQSCWDAEQSRGSRYVISDQINEWHRALANNQYPAMKGLLLCS